MMRLLFILSFWLGMTSLFSQTVDTLEVKTKDTLINPINPQRSAKNKAFYEKYGCTYANIDSQKG